MVKKSIEKRSIKQEDQAIGSLAKKAYDAIRKMLFLNEITPGQKINYRDLAERIGTSPTPVVQALKWLEFQGLVHNEPNRGFFLGPVSLDEVKEVYEIREVLEISLLPKLIKNLDEEKIRVIKEVIEVHKKAIAENYRHQRLITAMNFHLTLASLSGSVIGERFLRQLFDILYLKYKPDILFSRPLDQKVYIHDEILKYIVNGDVEKAQSAMKTDIHQVKKHVLEGIRLTMSEMASLNI